MSEADSPLVDDALYKSALEVVGDGILMVDPRGAIRWANQSAAVIFGAGKTGLTGRTLDEVMPPEHAANHQKYLRDFPNSPVPKIIGKSRYIDGRTLQGKPLDLHINVTCMDNGAEPLFLAIVRDVSMEREFQRSLQHRSTYDFITQLMNREGFAQAAGQRLAQAQADGDAMWLGILNISGIGKINHWIGYEAGDLALHEVGFRMKAIYGEQAIIGRVDGNEFAILLPAERAPRSPDDLAASAKALGYEIDVGGRSIDVSFSCGGAFSQDGAADESFNDFFARARTALREARMSSADHAAVFYDGDLDRRERIARTLENELVHALARDEFFIEVQPKVAMNREVSGYEALLRWRTTEGELVPPGVFIPIAEANGTIRTIGLWVFQEVCKLAATKEFQARGLRISVNLSPRQMESGTLPDMLAKICLDSGADPGQIELEVTESWAVKDFSRGSGMLERLKAKGFGISLDDFGTGYSSLGALVRLPVDIIKIDRTLLPLDVADNVDAQKLLGATIDLCRAMGREVLVEGVETEEQFRVLAESGCDLAQGYLFGKPRPYEAVPGAAEAQEKPSTLVSQAS